MKPNLKSIGEIAKEIVALYKEEVMEDKMLQELAKENNEMMVNKLCNSGEDIPSPMENPEDFVQWQLRFVNENVMSFSEHTMDELKRVHLRFAEKARKIMGIGKCPITVLEAIGEIDQDIMESIEVYAEVGLYNETESNREYREKLCKANEVFHMRRKDRVIEEMKRATIE
jgi:hypothetical protein